MAEGESPQIVQGIGVELGVGLVMNDSQARQVLSAWQQLNGQQVAQLQVSAVVDPTVQGGQGLADSIARVGASAGQAFADTFDSRISGAIQRAQALIAQMSQKGAVGDAARLQSQQVTQQPTTEIGRRALQPFIQDYQRAEQAVQAVGRAQEILARTPQRLNLLNVEDQIRNLQQLRVALDQVRASGVAVSEQSVQGVARAEQLARAFQQTAGQRPTPGVGRQQQVGPTAGDIRSESLAALGGVRAEVGGLSAGTADQARVVMSEVAREITGIETEHAERILREFREEVQRRTTAALQGQRERAQVLGEQASRGILAGPQAQEAQARVGVATGRVQTAQQALVAAQGDVQAIQGAIGNLTEQIRVQQTVAANAQRYLQESTALHVSTAQQAVIARERVVAETGTLQALTDEREVIRQRLTAARQVASAQRTPAQQATIADDVAAQRTLTENIRRQSAVVARATTASEQATANVFPTTGERGLGQATRRAGAATAGLQDLNAIRETIREILPQYEAIAAAHQRELAVLQQELTAEEALLNIERERAALAAARYTAPIDTAANISATRRAQQAQLIAERQQAEQAAAAPALGPVPMGPGGQPWPPLTEAQQAQQRIANLQQAQQRLTETQSNLAASTQRLREATGQQAGGLPNVVRLINEQAQAQRDVVNAQAQLNAARAAQAAAAPAAPPAPVAAGPAAGLSIEQRIAGIPAAAGRATQSIREMGAASAQLIAQSPFGGLLRGIQAFNQQLLYSVNLFFRYALIGQVINQVHQAITAITEAYTRATRAQFELTQAVGKGAAPELESFARAAARPAGRAGIDVLETVGNLAKLRQEYGLTNDEVEKLTKTVLNLSAVNNETTERVTNAVYNAVRGQGRALADLGVDVSARAVKQLADLTDAERKNYENLGATEQARVRVNEILRQSATYSQAAAEFADSQAGAYQRLGAAATDLAEQLGNLFAPVARFFATNLGGAAEQLRNILEGYQQFRAYQTEQQQNEHIYASLGGTPARRTALGLTPEQDVQTARTLSGGVVNISPDTDRQVMTATQVLLTVLDKVSQINPSTLSGATNIAGTERGLALQGVEGLAGLEASAGSAVSQLLAEVPGGSTLSQVLAQPVGGSMLTLLAGGVPGGTVIAGVLKNLTPSDILGILTGPLAAGSILSILNSAAQPGTILHRLLGGAEAPPTPGQQQQQRLPGSPQGTTLGERFPAYTAIPDLSAEPGTLSFPRPYRGATPEARQAEAQAANADLIRQAQADSRAGKLLSDAEIEALRLGLDTVSFNATTLQETIAIQHARADRIIAEGKANIPTHRSYEDPRTTLERNPIVGRDRSGLANLTPEQETTLARLELATQKTDPTETIQRTTRESVQGINKRVQADQQGYRDSEKELRAYEKDVETAYANQAKAARVTADATRDAAVAALDARQRLLGVERTNQDRTLQDSRTIQDRSLKQSQDERQRAQTVAHEETVRHFKDEADAYRQTAKDQIAAIDVRKSAENAAYQAATANLEEQGRALQDTYQAETNALEEQSRQIDHQAQVREKQIQSELDLIDKQEQARSDTRQDEENRRHLDDARRGLAQALTERANLDDPKGLGRANEGVIQAQQQILDATRAESDAVHDREVRGRRDALKEQQDRIRDQAKVQTDAIDAQRRSLESANRAATRGLQDQREQLQKNHEAQTRQFDQERTAVETLRDARVQAVEDAGQAEAASYQEAQYALQDRFQRERDEIERTRLLEDRAIQDRRAIQDQALQDEQKAVQDRYDAETRAITLAHDTAVQLSQDKTEAQILHFDDLIEASRKTADAQILDIERTRDAFIQAVKDMQPEAALAAFQRLHDIGQSGVYTSPNPYLTPGNTSAGAAGGVDTQAANAQRRAAEDQGAATAQGYAQGVSENTPLGERAMLDLAKRTRDVLTFTNESRSPSRVYAREGDNAVQGVALGLQRSTPVAEHAAANMATDTVNAAAGVIGPHGANVASAIAGGGNFIGPRTGGGDFGTYGGAYGLTRVPEGVSQGTRDAYNRLNAEAIARKGQPIDASFSTEAMTYADDLRRRMIREGHHLAPNEQAWWDQYQRHQAESRNFGLSGSELLNRTPDARWERIQGPYATHMETTHVFGGANRSSALPYTQNPGFMNALGAPPMNAAPYVSADGVGRGGGTVVNGDIVGTLNVRNDDDRETIIRSIQHVLDTLEHGVGGLQSAGYPIMGGG